MTNNHPHYDRIRNHLALMYRGTSIKFDYLHYKVDVTFTQQGIFQVKIQEVDTTVTYTNTFTSMRKAVEYILI